MKMKVKEEVAQSVLTISMGDLVLISTGSEIGCYPRLSTPTLSLRSRLGLHIVS